MNLIDYINSTEEPSADKLDAVKHRIIVLLKTIAPDLKIEENIVLQELLLDNFARIVALAEEGQKAELSDIQLSNIINGNIYDCEFVEAFVKSLGLEYLTTANTFGILRIKFSADAINNSQFLENGIYLDAGTSIGFDDTYMFRFYLCHSGKLNIKFPKSNLTFKQFSPASFLENNVFYAYIEDVVSNDDPGLNNKDFFRPYVYTVDLPIYGPSNASLSAGDIAATDIDSDLLNNYITSIELVQDIEPIDLPTNIIDLALLAKRIYPNPKANTKPGIISYFSRYMPFIESISPETLSSNNKPILNVYAKKGLNPITVTQVIPRSYAGIVALAAFPREFTEATYRKRIKTSDDIISALATAEYEDKTLSIGKPIVQDDFINLTCVTYNSADNTLDPVESFNAPSNIFMIPNIYLYNEDTSKYDIIDFTKEDQFTFNYMTITYTYDPALLFLRSLKNNPYINKDFDIRIKSYIDVHLDGVNIIYEQKINTYFDRQNAKQEIFKYINTCSNPLNPFDIIKIKNIILENGATNVTDIYFYGKEKLTAYTSFINYSNNKILAGDIQTPSISSSLTTDEGKNYVLENSMPITKYNIAYSMSNEDAIDLEESSIS